MTGRSLSWIDGRWGEANAPELPLNDRQASRAKDSPSMAAQRASQSARES